MTRQIDFHWLTVHPQDRTSAEQAIGQVMAAVDMTPTRGGQIECQTLIGNETGRYGWLVSSDTFGGEWLSNRLNAARNEMAAVANIYQTTSFEVLGAHSIEGAQAHNGVGAEGDLLRIYDLQAESAEHADWLILAAGRVALHPANRIGHSTAAVGALREFQGPLSSGTDRFKLLISHQVYESFAHINTFESDLQAALDTVRQSAAITRFDEYEIVKKIQQS